MDTRVLSAHVTVELAQMIDEAAVRLDRPKGWIVKQALTSWLALEEKRHQLTLQALHSVEKGRLVDHSAIKAWASGRRKPENP